MTEIGFIGERLTGSKERAFCEIMKERLGGYDPSLIYIGERFADGAYNTTKRLLEKKRVPRALVCAYDYLAIGAIRALTEAGLKIPEDVAVLGMDNLPEAKYLNSPLSSTDPNFEGVCEAAETLINILMGKSHEQTVVIDSVLHLRRSTEI